jgi:hypothetical protein
VTITIRAGGRERDPQIVAFSRRAVRLCDDFGFFESIAVAFGCDRLELIFEIGDFGERRRQIAVGCGNVGQSDLLPFVAGRRISQKDIVNLTDGQK